MEPFQSSDPLVDLLRELIDRTRAGKINWVPASGTDGFQFVGSRASVLIRARDEDAAPPYVLELFSGTEFVDLLTSDWDEPEDFNGERIPRPWNSDLFRLFLLARRSALRIDELVASLISDIDTGFDGQTATLVP